MGRYVINKDGERELVFRTEKKKEDKPVRKQRKLHAVKNDDKPTAPPEQTTTKGEQS